MKNLNWLLSLGLSLVIFSACAPKPDNTDETNRILNEQEKLKRRYDSISGAYRGQVSVSTGGYTYPVSLSLYTIDEEVGRTSDGQVKTLPVLLGSLVSEQIQELFYPLVLRAEYHEETGQLILIPLSKDISASDIRYHAFKGSTDGNRFGGRVTVSAGLQGDFSFQLQTRDTSFKPGPEKPEPGSPIYDYARVRFSEVTGVYCISAERQKYELRLEVVEQDKPVLVGFFRNSYSATLPLSLRMGSYQNKDSFKFSSSSSGLNVRFDGTIDRSNANQIVLDGDLSIAGITQSHARLVKSKPGEGCLLN